MANRLVAALAVLVAVVVMVFSLPLPVQAESDKKYTREQFFRALRIKECGDVANPPKGDGGKALGPYQIWREYYRDAVDSDESLRAAEKAGRLSYENCQDPNWAHMIVGAYLRRYALKAWDTENWESLARLHNGGPGWRLRGGEANERRWRNATAYWRDVEKILASLN